MRGFIIYYIIFHVKVSNPALTVRRNVLMLSCQHKSVVFSGLFCDDARFYSVGQCIAVQFVYCSVVLCSVLQCSVCIVV